LLLVLLTWSSIHFLLLFLALILVHILLSRSLFLSFSIRIALLSGVLFLGFIVHISVARAVLFLSPRIPGSIPVLFLLPIPDSTSAALPLLSVAGTLLGLDDLQALLISSANPDYLIVPKCNLSALIGGYWRSSN
jgi:hypothetical protein